MGLLVSVMNGLPPEFISLLMILTAYSSVIVLMRAFGVHGLMAYMVIALIGANIQVLKIVKFSIFGQPVALGTELFSSIYLAVDVIAENYGTKSARKSIWLGFACQVIFNIFMIITLFYRPYIDPADVQGAADAKTVEAALKMVIQPQIGLVAAGLISFLISQHCDVTIFTWIRKETGGSMLWLRNGAANIISALFDNIVFSVLAWEVFATQPVGMRSLIFTYILGTFYIRVLISVLDTPFIYLSRKFRRTPTEALAA